jgi:hypothetical protein
VPRLVSNEGDGDMFLNCKYASPFVAYTRALPPVYLARRLLETIPKLVFRAGTPYGWVACA